MKYLLFAFLTIPFSFSSFSREWDYYTSTPDIMGPYYQKDFSSLPLSGKVKDQKKYWSGHYWPNREGSINNRWNGRGYGYLPDFPALNELKKMRVPELAALSPSEKLDILNGNYDYPLVYEVAKFYRPGAPLWEGICHGWSAATMNHPEPRPVLLTNPDGIEIPFGSSDIKALLSYYYAFSFRPIDTFQMGVRCEEKKKFTTSECLDDLNAGAFHIVLGNRVGLEEESFVADINRSNIVENHPIWGYNTRVLGELPPQASSSPRSKKVIKVETEVIYVNEKGVNWHPILGTKNQSYIVSRYQYLLELDQEGKIVGGEWLSWEHPDFIWRMEKPRSFDGHFRQIYRLL